MILCCILIIWINFVVSTHYSFPVYGITVLCNKSTSSAWLWCVPCNSNPSWFDLVCLIPYSVAAAIVFKKKIAQYVEIYQTNLTSVDLLEISFTHIWIDLSSFMRILYSTSLILNFHEVFYKHLMACSMALPLFPQCLAV